MTTCKNPCDTNLCYIALFLNQCLAGFRKTILLGDVSPSNTPNKRITCSGIGRPLVLLLILLFILLLVLSLIFSIGRKMVRTHAVIILILYEIGMFESLTTMSIYPCWDDTCRLTSTFIPIAITTLLGMSSISRLALAMPTISRLSFTPMQSRPPYAFANPQIHFKYSSCQDSLYSTLCDSFCIMGLLLYCNLYMQN